jgi:multimeric flavodoxin WrbA
MCYYVAMAKILILYHSQTGNTETLARAVAQGVRETENSTAILKPAAEAGTQDLKECNGFVICSPEYFGYMAGAIKDFFDRTYEELKDGPAMYKKPFCIVISAGNDGSGALMHIERICKGYRFKKVQEPIISRGPITTEMMERCFILGRTIAEGIKARIF